MNTTQNHTLATRFCKECSAIVTHRDCTNPACSTAHRAASRPVKGETIASRLAPTAFTIRGNID